MPDQPATVYRLRPYVRHVALGGLAFTGLAGSASVAAALSNVDGSFPAPERAAWIMGSIWSAFFLLSAWLGLTHRRYRLELGPASVRQRGVVQDRSVRYDAVRRLEWRRVPSGGSVRLHGPAAPITIEFGSLPDDARAAVIERLAGQIPAARQQGWAEFRGAPVDPAARQAQAWRARRGLAGGFMLIALIFLVAAACGQGLSYIVFAAMNGLAAVLMVRRAGLRRRIQAS